MADVPRVVQIDSPCQRDLDEFAEPAGEGVDGKFPFVRGYKGISVHCSPSFTYRGTYVPRSPGPASQSGDFRRFGYVGARVGPIEHGRLRLLDRKQWKFF